jgi:hypothetical protein
MHELMTEKANRERTIDLHLAQLYMIHRGKMTHGRSTSVNTRATAGISRPNPNVPHTTIFWLCQRQAHFVDCQCNATIAEAMGVEHSIVRTHGPVFTILYVPVLEVLHGIPLPEVHGNRS